MNVGSQETTVRLQAVDSHQRLRSPDAFRPAAPALCLLHARCATCLAMLSGMCEALDTRCAGTAVLHYAVESVEVRCPGEFESCGRVGRSPRFRGSSRISRPLALPPRKSHAASCLPDLRSTLSIQNPDFEMDSAKIKISDSVEDGKQVCY